jgi:hypothetical protein
MNNFRIALIFALGMLVFGCSGSNKKPEESMTQGHARFGVADAAFDVARLLADDFETIYNAAFIDLFRFSDRDLIDSLLSQRTEQIILDRRLEPAETLAFHNAGLHLYQYPVAYYPLYLLIPKSIDSVSALDSTQLRGALTGVVTNWKSLRGADQALHVYIPQPGDAGWTAMTDYFGQLDSIVATACPTASAMLDSAGDDPGALLIYDKPIADLLNSYKALAFQRDDRPIWPNVKSILDSVSFYPFHLTLTYVTTKDKMDVAAGYLTYCVGNAGQRRMMDALTYRPAAVPVHVVFKKQ